MHEIRTVVSIILAIFPVILFFKLWGMANNVKMIKRELIDNKDEYKEYELLLIRGENDKAYHLLVNKFSREIYDTYHFYDEYFYKNKIEKLFEIYKPEFQKIEKEIPEHLLKCKDFEYIQNLMN